MEVEKELSYFQAAAFAMTGVALHALLTRQTMPVHAKDAPKQAAEIGLNTAKAMLSEGVIPGKVR